MLADGDAAQWVGWKLDNGIRHMLLDEAQDTSPAQWQLLRRLSDEFFEAGADAADEKLGRAPCSWSVTSSSRSTRRERTRR